MKPHDFIALFQRLAARGGAAESRTAVGRAYYGVLHLAIELLVDAGCQPPRSGAAHSDVPAYLRCSDNGHARSAGRMLGDLHTDRLRADYRLNDLEIESVTAARVCVDTAAQVVVELEQFRAVLSVESTRSQLQESVTKLKSVRAGRLEP